MQTYSYNSNLCDNKQVSDFREYYDMELLPWHA